MMNLNKPDVFSDRQLASRTMVVPKFMHKRGADERWSRGILRLFIFEPTHSISLIGSGVAVK